MVSRISDNNVLGPDALRFTDEMAEVSLLLPGGQAQALEAAAHARGLTAGQVIRKLIRDFCSSDMLDQRDRFVTAWGK